MNIWGILLILALQTSTPTPMPTDARFAPMVFPTLSSPTPIPSSTSWALPSPQPLTGDLIYQLATAENTLQDVPSSFDGYVPSETGADLFAYAKWLLSAKTSAELFGPFAPIVTHLLTAITLVIILAVVAFLVFIAVLILRFIVWLATLLLKLIPFWG